MKTWDQVIKDALYYHVHADQYAYFYGAKGVRLTDAEMNYLWNAEKAYFESHYPNPEDKKRIFDWSRGKIGFDCSGFISRVTGCPGNSGSLFERCHGKTTDLASGPAASLLWMPGHIGLDIGYGYYLQTGRECESITMGRISEKTIAWQKTGKLTGWIDYTGATNR